MNHRSLSRLIFLATLVAGFIFPVAAHAAVPVAALTVTPVTWNVVGLDSNTPTAGPQNFPVGVRVCSNVATTNVAVNFIWDSANANINLRSGSPSSLTLPSISAGGCADAYFEVSVNQVVAAFDTTRRYHITAADGSGTVSTTVPREIYVEHLISQSRNSIADIKYGTSLATLASVPGGAAMNLVVGNTYFVQLLGGTATQGYNQFEAFINFPNTIFQILSVSTTYSANDAPPARVPNPNPSLYADACGWDSDPNSPTYLSCIGGDFKAGGSNVVTTYQIKVLSGGGTSQTLNTLLYDFSGSSFHYNADYASGSRVANVIDPASSTIAKSFSPNPSTLNGVSALTITLGNPNAGALSGYNFVDNLPANMLIANPANATTSGCGTPTLTATAGASTISFSNGTVAANGTCVIKVNVTATATGTLNNTTNNLFVDSVDTGKTASASLTVNNDPPPGTGICGITLAQWTFPAGFSVASPAPSTDNAPGTPSAKPGDGVAPSSFTEGTNSWGSNGSVATGTTLVIANEDYLEFAVDTTGFTGLQFSFDAGRKNTPNSPRGIAVFAGTSSLTTDAVAGNGAATDPGTSVLAANATALPLSTAAFTSFGPLTLPNGTTHVRIYLFNSGNTNSGSDAFVDNVTFTGCRTAIKPTITKAFAPNPIAVNGVSTLTFSLTNTDTAALTGAAFTDALPSGVQVAATPAAATTCAGTWAPAAAATTLTFSGGTIPAASTCTVSVNVTATTAGPKSNVSGFLSTTESGTTTTSVATATLTAVLPPSISKLFSPSSFVAGGTGTLTFTITNPNSNNALAGVAFSDSLPGAPGAMSVATTPAASTSGCGAPTFAPAAGATTLTFTGGTIAAGGTCVVSVKITAPTAGTYNNTSGNVSHIINAVTVNGNTANASLTVTPAAPAISLLKQVGPTVSGPWTSYLQRDTTTNNQVFYRFSLENIGNVALNTLTLTDNTLSAVILNSAKANCVQNGGAPTTLASLSLAVPNASNDNHLVTCITTTPFTITSNGSVTNTATGGGTFPGNGTIVTDSSSARFATTGLTLAKSVTQTFYQAAGDVLNYSYLVTNSGFAPLAGPVTVSDNKATVTCPAVTTVGDLDNFLDPGESLTCSATYTIIGTDVSNGSVTNIATATASGVNSNSDSRTVNWRAANLSMTKTLVTAGPYSVGQTLTYTLTVANAGPSTATNVQVTDTTTNLTITGVSGSGCAALPCTIASIANGSNAIITVTATINAAGAFDNSASVTATELDPVPANNTDNTGNGGSAASADVSVVKTLVTGGTYTVGQTITYTLFVANAGPSTATNVQVTDTPTNLTIASVSGGGCAALPCTIASLASGANATITVTATINAVGAFDNSATVTATESDPVPANNTDNTGNNGNAVASADVSLVKTLVTAGPYASGQSLTYTLLIANAGPSTATSIQVTDTPVNLTITSVSGSGCASLPCTIPSLGSGANTSITVIATILGNSTFDNAATATATEPDPVPANNTDNTGNGSSVAVANVSIVKTLVTAGPYTAGQSISYTLLIANAGPSTATGIQVTDTPTNLSITSVSGSGCAALPCTIASLASGANTSITVTATIVSGGAFDNSATATGTEFDPDPTDNTDNTGNNGVVPSADVSIVKTLLTAGPYNLGQTVNYTLFIANAGPSIATNIQVTDTPANLTITSVSGSGCAALPCTIASLGIGANTTINVSATTTAVGSFNNAASVTANEFDPNSSNNTDTIGNGGEVGAAADISVVKTLTTASPYNVGQTVSYTLLVANAGPSIATNIQVTDTPSNLTITSVSGSGCAALPCTIASLGVGANTSITVTATINAGGIFDNSTTVTATEFDPNIANNTDNTGNSGTTGASADVSIVKTLLTAAPYTPGQSVSYSLVIANAGPSTATNVQVTDTPTNLTITSVSGSGCVALPCTIASLAAGANTTVNVTATIAAAGAFDNSATVTATEFDPNLVNNTDNTGNNGATGPVADISVVKTLLTAGPFAPAQSISYTLQIANAGPAVATNIQVTDTPTNLTIVSVGGAGCVALPCTIPSLAVGANVLVTVTATINAAGAFDNSVTVAATEFDPNLVNNTDNTGNGGVASATSVDLAITKTTTVSSLLVGQTFDYTLVVTNNGPATASGVLVTDPLPPTFTLVSATSTQGTCSGTTTVICSVGTMLNGATVTITLRGSANAAGTLSNSATVSSNETESVVSNNVGAAAIIVSAGANVPTASEFGLAMLAFMLALGGAFILRGRF